MQTRELTQIELQSIDGGIIPFIIIGAAALLTSCGNSQKNKNESGSNAVNINCSNCTVIVDNCGGSVSIVEN